MSRVQLALNVDNLAEGVAFYSKLFNAAARQAQGGLRQLRHRRAAAQAGPDREPRPRRIDQPSRRRGRIQRPGARKKLPGSSGEGMFTEEEIGTTCCFATQDKVWVTGPGGEKWEVYTVLADSETFGTTPELLAADPTGGCSCAACDSADADVKRRNRRPAADREPQNQRDMRVACSPNSWVPLCW